jgi:hypothetical protein
MTRQRFACGLALLAASALSTPAAAESYASLSLGEGTFKGMTSLNFDGSVTGTREDDTDQTLRFALGSPTGDNLAFELGYVDLGETTATGVSDGSQAGVGGWQAGPVSTTIAIDGLDITVVGRIPLGESFALIARGGLFLWQLESTRRQSTGRRPFNDDGTDPCFGAGAQLNVGPSLSFRGEFTRYTIENIDVDSLSLSAILRFDG